MIEPVVVTTKAIVTGSVSIALLSVFQDVEIIFLIITGLFSSLSSFFYDWVHRHPLTFGLKEFSELIKYALYGLSVIFIVYYLGKNHGAEFVNLPPSVWGFIGALCAGSAISIVETFKNLFLKFLEKKIK